MRRYLIVGSGAAGIAAAEAIRRADAAGEITLLSEERSGYYSRPGLAYYLTGELPESALFPYTREDFNRLNLRLAHTRAERVDLARHQLLLSGGRSLAYDRLLIATGAEALRPDLTGIALEGVVKLDNLEDARHILGLARNARRAVVIGGGITALELVEGLLAHKVQVHYLLRGEHYWSSVLDEAEAEIVEARLLGEGVILHCHSEVQEILEKRGRAAGVRTNRGEVIPGEIVAYAIGVRPRTALSAASGLRVERGILVDAHLQTSAPDIFAAGDAAQAFDPLSGKYLVDSLWGPARAQGLAAGANMAGGSVEYLRAPACNVTRLTRLPTTIIGMVSAARDVDLAGIAHGESETWRQTPEAIVAQARYEVNRLRLLVGANSLLGAVVMGDQAISRPVQQMVSAQVDVTPIREQLLRPGAPLAELVQTYWRDVVNGHAVQQF